MLQLMRRTAMAERQAARRLARRKAKNRADQAERTRATKQALGEIGLALKQAIVARHEDWELGPLAPRRDIPARSETNDTFHGTVSGERLKPSVAPRKEALERRCAWAGGVEHLSITEGDRAVVLEGPHKGRIAPIKRVLKDIGYVELDDQTIMTNVSVPGHMASLAPAENQVQVMADPIPISAIRLVHPLKDEATGVTRDVIIKKLVPQNRYFDRATRVTTWSRVVPGLNVKIPWPRKEDPVYDDHPVDTLRIDVEEKTFVPTLLRPPVPEALIDELRNRYSIFRTRHEPEYVARKEAELAEKEARTRMVDTMRTPLMELNRKQREERKARGQPVLTDEMLEKIGELMARNRQRRLAEAGVAEVEAGERP
ncbi:hypothetical protein NKR23_g7577 [Pleurostoma richardsiae]|uniref:KOW domain-containing protein n=1 Tax=Pleurostoma richardsiae TaxID=41990 RepID=A0AA38VGP2_9PEZI|nr:hypothetical protein NKR23_g7577 [Pleurostoma richardsiae]